MSAGFLAPAAEPLPDGVIPAPAWYRPGIALVMTNAAAAEREATQRLEAARAAHNSTEEAYALLFLAASHGRRSDTANGGKYSSAALELARLSLDPNLLAEARGVHAGMELASAHLTSAVELYLQNLPAAEAGRNRRRLRETLMGLAECYEGLGNPTRTIEFARRTVTEAEAAGDFSTLGLGWALQARASLNLGDAAEARRCFNLALAAQRQGGRPIEIADTEESLAMLDFRDGRAAAALPTLERVEAQRRTLRGKARLTITLTNRAEVLQGLGRLDEALAAIEEARGYAEAMGSPATTSPVYRRLALVQEARGEFAEALKAQRRHQSDELKFSAENVHKQVAELQTRYNVAKKDQELTQLARTNEVTAAELRANALSLAKNNAELRAAEADLARARAVRFGLIGGALVGAAALGAVLLAQRARLRAESARLQAERIRSEETRRARAVAEEANALKTKLLGIASHDLKAPLRAMLMRADTLEPALAGSPAGADTLTHLRDDGERMLSLVHDLLVVSAIESGELRLTLMPVELSPLVAEAVRGLQLAAQKKSIALNCAFSPAAAWVRGDRARLHQVITNLVDNAVKFSPPGKSVFVSVAASETEVIFSVRDEGPGISPEDLARIYQPFRSLSATPTGGESSSGLGLHICREIVGAHGGRIEVNSRPGEGATFSVVFAALPPEAGQANEAI